MNAEILVVANPQASHCDMTAPFLSQAGDDLLDRSSPTTIGGDADRKVMMLGPQPGQLDSIAAPRKSPPSGEDNTSESSSWAWTR